MKNRTKKHYENTNRLDIQRKNLSADLWAKNHYNK